jgi:AraC family transcriptional regulator of adaptative response / DNA-3-methyladenine glycosylase II
MRVIGAPDVFLANDAAVRNGIRNLPTNLSTEASAGRGTGSATDLSPDFSEVSPWRSYATMHLWRAAAAPKTTLTTTADAKATT